MDRSLDNTPGLSALSASSSVMSTSTESSSTMISFDMLNESNDTVTLINNIAYNYVALCIVGIGIFGNILNLIVLTRPKLKGKLTVKEFSLPVFFYILYHHKTQIRSIL